MESVVVSNDSPSLWNHSIAPGWTSEETRVLRLSVMKYGMGNWTQIVCEGVLPGKTIAQLVCQIQRMLGQQSIKEYLHIHLDPLSVRRVNMSLDLPLKNGMIVNSGRKMLQEDVYERRKINTLRYGLTKKEIESIRIPIISKDSTITRPIKIDLLQRLKEEQKVLYKRYHTAQKRMLRGQIIPDYVLQSVSGIRSVPKTPGSEPRKRSRHSDSEEEEEITEDDLQEDEAEERYGPGEDYESNVGSATAIPASQEVFVRNEGPTRHSERLQARAKISYWEEGFDPEDFEAW